MQASAGDVFAGLWMGVPFPADALDDCTRDLHARIEAAFRGETHEGDHERGRGGAHLVVVLICRLLGVFAAMRSSGDGCWNTAGHTPITLLKKQLYRLGWRVVLIKKACHEVRESHRAQCWWRFWPHSRRHEVQRARVEGVAYLPCPRKKSSCRTAVVEGHDEGGGSARCGGDASGCARELSTHLLRVSPSCLLALPSLLPGNWGDGHRRQKIGGKEGSAGPQPPLTQNKETKRSLTGW